VKSCRVKTTILFLHNVKLVEFDISQAVMVGKQRWSLSVFVDLPSYMHCQSTASSSRFGIYDTLAYERHGQTSVALLRHLTFSTTEYVLRVTSA